MEFSEIDPVKWSAALEAGLLWHQRRKEPLSYELAGLDLLFRRFGLNQFGSAAALFLQRVKETRNPVLRIFSRLVDPAAVLLLEDWTALTGENDRLTVPALYSDQHPLPKDYAESLQTHARRGGYALTHTALALMWLRDLDVNRPTPAAFEDQVVEGLIELTRSGWGLDLRIEAAVFLCYLRSERLLSGEVIDEVIKSQRSDGGWTRHGGVTESNWHTSGLATWLLLEIKPSPKMEPMVPRRLDRLPAR